MNHMEEHHVDAQGTRFGMWLFLLTEIMLFGGLFILYSAYYSEYTADFIKGGKHLDVIVGTANTVILLVSSFAVASAFASLLKKRTGLSMIFLGAAVLLGLVFLINKYFEWSHKFADGIYPGSDLLASYPKGEILFYSLYFTITGLHALHVIIGMIVLALALYMVKKGKCTPDRPAFVENAGLYWHLVDILWIFIFPLFYLLL